MQLPPLWICGNSSVQLFDPNAPFDAAKPAWNWDSKTAAGIPDERREWFLELDEVKPVLLAGEPCILVTASWRGGCALIRRSDGAVLFTLNLANAHSAELLPDGWIAIAGSGGSDKLVIQHVSAGVQASGARAEFPLPSGHGAVFEPQRSLLWVSGASRVELYHWVATSGQFVCERVREITLPDFGAHDMQPHPAGERMLVTTANDVWDIDASTYELGPFKPLAGQKDVKGVSIEAGSGAIAYVQGEKERWWSEDIHLLFRDGSPQRLTLPGRYLYKARWDQSCWLNR